MHALEGKIKNKSSGMAGGERCEWGLFIGLYVRKVDRPGYVLYP